MPYGNICHSVDMCVTENDGLTLEMAILKDSSIILS